MFILGLIGRHARLPAKIFPDGYARFAFGDVLSLFPAIQLPFRNAQIVLSSGCIQKTHFKGSADDMREGIVACAVPFWRMPRLVGV